MTANSNPYSGWLCVNKPLGMGSTEVVSKVRKALGMRKVGHAGTLDPLASGVLPIAIGEATKTIPFIQDDLKIYEFEVTWGESTSTDDKEGEVVEISPIRPAESQIQSILHKFIGRIGQVPPKYSALKINGKRAYTLAREGVEFEMKTREIYVKSLNILENCENKAMFRVTCGKGTYVRSLARDMALTLGTVGHVSILKRTHVGQFCLDKSVEGEKLLELDPQSVLEKGWYSLREALDDILAFEISDNQANELRHGRQIEYPDALPDTNIVFVETSDRTPVAICEIQENHLQPKRVFNC